MANSLGAIIATLDLAGRTFRIVRQNLFWAPVYNTAGISLAGAMVFSSLSVIGNSRRL